MEFIKNIARKILDDEFKEIENKVKEYKGENKELREELAKIKDKHDSEILKADKKNIEINAEKIRVERKLQELEKENEILRQYYDLDKEPSDEIKMKIHIDLEINRLKEEKDDLKNEILRLTAICRPPMIIQQPYPYYGFGYRPF